MAVVPELEQPVHEDGPGDLGPDVGTDDGRGHLGVVLGRQVVADVVDERGHDHLDVGSVGLRSSGRLARVLEPTDLVSGDAVVQAAQSGQDPVGEPGDVGRLRALEELVVLEGTVLHAGELHRLHVMPRFARACAAPPV